MHERDHPAVFKIVPMGTAQRFALLTAAARVLCGVNIFIFIPALVSIVFIQRDTVSFVLSLCGFMSLTSKPVSPPGDFLFCFNTLAGEALHTISYH